MLLARDGYELDGDRERLAPHLPAIAEIVSSSYWGRTTPVEDIVRSWETAGLVLGLYRDADLVGGCRAVTDFARFAYLSDVWVDPAHRGAGLGVWMIGAMIEHPSLPPNRVRWTLNTGDAHALYARFGFGPAGDSAMSRPRTYVPPAT